MEFLVVLACSVVAVCLLRNAMMRVPFNRWRVSGLSRNAYIILDKV